MIKMNDKGFMMAELVVVSSIVLVVLVAMYTSFNKIYSIYKSRIGYYDVTTLYRLGFYRDVLVYNNTIEGLKNNAVSSGIVEITNSIPGEDNVDDKVFMIYNNKKKIDSSIFGSINVSSTFKDYVDYLKDSIDFSNFEYMLIMERCDLNGGSVDIDSCNYSYLEVFPYEDTNIPESNNSTLIIYDTGIFGTNKDGTKFSVSTKKDGESTPSFNNYIDRGFMNWYCDHSTWVTFYIAQKVDCTDYSTLNITFSGSDMNVDEPIRWGIMSTASYEQDNFVKYKSYGNYDVFGGSGTISLDISDKNGEYYLAMWGWPDGWFDMDVTKIWLE